MHWCSLLRQSASLESLIRDQLSAKQPEAYEWFFSEQVPFVVTSFVNYFEGDSRFTAATIAYVIIFCSMCVIILLDGFEGHGINTAFNLFPGLGREHSWGLATQVTYLSSCLH